MAFGLGAILGMGWATVPRLRSDDCGASADRLVVATGADVSLNRQRQVLIGLWNDKVRGSDPVAVLEELPGVTDQQRSQMFAAVQSGSCRYDVLNLDLPWIEEFYRAGFLQRLNPAGPADFRFEPGGFLSPSWQAGVRKGIPYAIPFNSDAGLLYYRADILHELGLRPPRTWADVDEISRRLHESGTPWHGVKAVYAGQLAPYEGLTVNLLELFWAAGGDLVKSDGSVARSPQTLEALKQLIERMGTDAPVVWQDSTRSHEAETIDAFAEGEVVLMRNWPYAFRALAADPDLNSPGGLKFGVTGLLGGPGRPGPSVLGGQSLAVPVNSAHIAAARRLIRHLTTDQSQKLLFSCGGFSPVREAAFAAEFCAREQTRAGVAAGRRTGGTEQARAREEEQLKVLASALRQAFRNVRPRPVTRYYSDFTAVLQRRVHPLLQTQSLAPDQREYDALLAGICDSLSGAGASPSPPGCG
ncbi:MAG TPA: extracellular solute-binding protein [Actinomadura sp.]|nr:extracellular solute-binding protein [Actinomadura sp.]